MLRRARRAAGLTQEELAERAGLSVRGVSDIERGARQSPRRDTIALLGKALGLTEDELRSWIQTVRARNRKPGVTSPSLVLFGRERETSALHSAIAAARSSRGSIVLIGGEPGVGKTSLCEQASVHAQQQGLRVVWGRCYEGEGAPAYWPWIQALRSLIGHANLEYVKQIASPGAGELLNLLPESEQWWPSIQPSNLEGESARFRLFNAVSVVLRSFAETRPLFIALDDLQWADRSSLLLLEYLTDDVQDSQIMIAGLYRDTDVDSHHPLAATVLEVRRRRVNSHLALGGLDTNSVSSILRSLVNEPVSKTMAETLTERTGGNPFFVSEIAQFLAAPSVTEAQSAAAEWEQAIPLGIRELIDRRLQRFSDDCRAVLSVASVIGKSFNLRVVSGVTGIRNDTLLDLLDEVTRAGLIDQPMGIAVSYRFTHDLVREAIYDKLSPSQRLSLHADVGRTLERLYEFDLAPHLNRIAYHYTIAAPVAGHDPAVRFLNHAGEQAMKQIAYSDAAQHFHTAVELTEQYGDLNSNQGAELLLKLGEARRRGGEIPNARESFQRAAAIARTRHNGAQLARAAIGMAPAIVLLGQGDPPAFSMLDEACNALDTGQSGTSALCLAYRALVHAGNEAPDVARRLELSGEALEVAREIDEPRALAVALHARHRDLWANQRFTSSDSSMIAAAAVDAAERTGDPELLFTMLCWRMFEPLALGDFDLVDSLLARCFKLAEELRQPFYEFMSTSLRSSRSIMAGHLASARELTDRAWAIASRVNLPQPYDVVWRWTLEFSILRETGQLAALEDFAREYFDTFLEDPGHWRLYRVQLHAALVLRWIAPNDTGSSESPSRLLSQNHELVAELVAANDYRYASHTRYALVHLAEAASILGNHQAADLLYKALEPQRHLVATVGGAFMSLGSVSRYLGLLATTLERWDDAERHFRDGLEMNERTGATLFAARTRHDWAGMLVKRGSPGDYNRAGELVDQVATVASDLDLPVLFEQAEQIRVRLREHAPPPDLPELSNREVEVLRLVARGYSNRKIADELFISVRTVENHVARILSKLHVSSRSAATCLAIEYGIVGA